jgi:hypothetical protein
MTTAVAAAAAVVATAAAAIWAEARQQTMRREPIINVM